MADEASEGPNMYWMVPCCPLAEQGSDQAWARAKVLEQPLFLLWQMSSTAGMFARH